MTYTIECKCGSKFYLSQCKETFATQAFAEKEAAKWRDDHRGCCDIKMDELPEDWKL